MKKREMFSPLQAASGALLGGPIALVYFLGANFLSLGKRREAKQTLFWGMLLNAVVLAALPFFPENFPNFLIPLALGLATYQVVSSRQMTKDAIAQSTEFTFESNWWVAGMSLGCALLFLVIVAAFLFGLDALGVWRHRR